MPSSKAKVQFFFEVPVTLKDRTKLKLFIVKLFNREKRLLNQLSYIFTSDKALLALNKKYLNHNYWTDIISFDLSEGKAISGEIYISVDRVKENANKLKTTFHGELHRVIFHGALHLCGYNDQTQAQKKSMRKQEDFYLKKYSTVS